MTFQTVRGYFEKITYQGLRLAGVSADHIFFDNTAETPPSPDATYAVISLTFADVVTPTIGCDGGEDLKGTLRCNIYSPKMQGSKPGEDACLEVIKSWTRINRATVDHAALVKASTWNIDGPRTIAPDERPHHVNVITCAFRGRAA